MQCLGWIQEAGRDTNAVERTGEFLGDVGILAHP
jgi:hypothetical protein